MNTSMRRRQRPGAPGRCAANQEAWFSVFIGWLLAAVCLGGWFTAQGGELVGASARAQFEGYVTNFGDTFINFESRPYNTALDTQLSAQGVTFASTIDVNGYPILTPHNVYVSSAYQATRGRTIVGTPYAQSGGDDGRIGYEVRFTTPQRRAGLLRIWNTNTITRFYTTGNVLLAEIHGSQFVGYIADSDDSTNWVKRIQLDGQEGGTGVRQVGYSDDLFFGSSPTNPPQLSLTYDLAPTLTITGLNGRQHRLQYLNAFGAVNNWLTLTNVTLTGSSATVQDTNGALPAARFYRALLLPLP